MKKFLILEDNEWDRKQWAKIFEKYGEKLCATATIPEKIENIARLISKSILDNCFIILSPHPRTCSTKPSPYTFFDNIEEALRRLGYKDFCYSLHSHLYPNELPSENVSKPWGTIECQHSVIDLLMICKQIPIRESKKLHAFLERIWEFEDSRFSQEVSNHFPRTTEQGEKILDETLLQMKSQVPELLRSQPDIPKSLDDFGKWPEIYGDSKRAFEIWLEFIS